MNELYIVMYHYTRDLVHSRYPGIKGLDILEFRHQIEYMKRNFNFVTMEMVMDAVENKCELPERALLLTFDDGYVDNYTFAFPVLEEYGVQGSFFISGKAFATHTLLDVNKIHYILASSDSKSLTADLKREMDYYRGNEYDYAPTDQLYNEYAKTYQFDSDSDVVFVKRMLQSVLPEKVRNEISSNLFKKYVGITEEQLAYELYMSTDQVRLMKKRGMYIGIHGYDHYWLSTITKEKLYAEIDKSLDVLDEFVDRKRWVMNYPYGDYSQQVLDCVASKGAIMGITVEARLANLAIDSPLILPRFDCNHFPPRSEAYKTL